MMSEHVPHHDVSFGHMATGTVVHQDDTVSKLPRVQDELNAMQLELLKHLAHITNLRKAVTFLHVWTIIKSQKGNIFSSVKMCRRLWYIGLCSRLGNSLQMGHNGMCINGTPTSLPMVIFFNRYRTFNCEHPLVGCTCTCLVYL
jgi:hypothetical protein